MRRAVTATAGVAGLAVAGIGGAAYWLAMSSYSQILGPFAYRADDHERPRVALTFDDGPNEPFTGKLADFLDAEGIRATFFQVGRAVRAFPEVSLRLAEAGHVIGNHSDTHTFGRYLHAATLRAEIERSQQTFQDIGIRPALYRPPWLLRIPALFPLLREYGLTPISGVFAHPLEFAQPSPRLTVHGLVGNGALGHGKPGMIIIFHDGFEGHAGDRANSVEAAKMTVAQLRRRGVEFTTVDRLLGIPAYQTT